MKLGLGSCLLVLGATLMLGGAARADDFFSARVSDLRGELSVRGEDEDDYSYIQRNAVIREGDTLWTDDHGRAEIELERGSWLRLAEDTKLEVRRLSGSPDFRLWNGSVYVDVSERMDGPIHVATPCGDVEVDPNSVVRVDLSKEDSARVSVFNGRAWATAERGERVRLTNGRRIYMEASHPLDEPTVFERDDRDDFDAFQRDRVDYYISRPLPRDLERDIIGGRELDDYGSWVEVESVRYWRPRCDPDWRPYSAGYWSYVPSCGYSWVDYQPWGYTTCHYGRWAWRPTYGWLWSPGYTWGPAYVSWSTCNGYYGWAPLDPFNRPVCYGSGSFVSIGFGIDFRSWTFCDRDRFFYGRHHPWFTGGRSVFVPGHRLRLNDGHGGFSVVRNFNHEIGVPREHVRGSVIGRDGSRSRDRVLQVENRIPDRRLQLISRTFKEDANRDRNLARRGGVVENFQRNPGFRVDNAHILKGDEADRRVSFRQTITPGRSAIAEGRENGGRGNRGNGDRVGDAGRGNGNNGPITRNGDNGNAGRRGDGNTAGEGRDRDSGFRRGGTANNGNGAGSRDGEGTARRGDRNGDGVNDRTGNPVRDRGNGNPGGANDDRQRPNNPAADRGAGNRGDNGDRDGGFRRNGGRDNGDRNGNPQGGNPGRGSVNPGPGTTPSNPGPNVDRGNAGRGGGNPDRGSAPDRGTPSRGGGTSPDRGNSDRGNSDRGNSGRGGSDRRDDDRRNDGRRSSIDRYSSPNVPSAAPDFRRGGDGTGRRAGDSQPAYRDFPYPAGSSGPARGDRDGGFRRGGVDTTPSVTPRPSGDAGSGSVFGGRRGGVDVPSRSYGGGRSYGSPSPGYTAPTPAPQPSYGGGRGGSDAGRSYGAPSSGSSYRGGGGSSAPSGGSRGGGSYSGGGGRSDSGSRGSTGTTPGSGSFGRGR